MPKKGRINPCDNPMGRKHTRKSQYKDVFPVGSDMLEQFREYLPKYNWPTGTRMCAACRGKAFKDMRHSVPAAEAVDALVQSPNPSVADLLAHGASLASNLGRKATKSTQQKGISQLQPGLSPGSQSSVQERTEASVSALAENQPSSSGLFSPSLPGEAEHLQTTEQPTKGKHSDPLDIDVGNNGNVVTPGASPGQSSVFVTPTRPVTTQYRSRLIDSLPSTPSLPSTVASPSVAGTSVSTESGSIYHDEQTAKEDFHNLLSKLGMSAPDKRTKSTPRKLFQFMSDGMAAFRKLLEQYVGRKVSETPPSCRHCELIVAAAKAKIPLTENKREKHFILSTLPSYISINMMQHEFGVSNYMAKLASKIRAADGPFSSPVWRSSGKPLSDSVMQAVKDFYLCNDNSRVNTAARECVYVRDEQGKKDKQAKRYMMANLSDSYQEFKRTNPGKEVGISKFAELRPRNVRWPGHKGLHISCLCPIHENFNLMLQGLKNASIEAIKQEFQEDATAAAKLQLFDDYKELLAYIICDPPTEDCYLGFCQMCPNEINMDEILKYSDGNSITYSYWEKNELTTRIEDQAVFEEKFPSVFAKFLTHEYIYQQQKQFIKSIKNGPLENGSSGVLTVDFGENYQFVVQNSIQSFHWNNNQATIHPFVFYTASSLPGKPEYMTYFVISDDLCHDASAFHCFRVRVMAKIKEQFPHIKNIDYVSDGAGSQYKNRKNIANLLFHQEDFGISARWFFSATGHGKNTCDALSAVVKQKTRLGSLYSANPILTPVSMFERATNELTSPHLEFIYVTRDDVEYWREKLKQRYSLVKTIPGTRAWHYLAVGNNKTLITKRYGFSDKSQTLEILEQEEEEEEISEAMDVDLEDITTAPILEVGAFYAISFKATYVIGEVTEIFDSTKSAKFRMMRKAGPGGISLSWPSSERIQEFDFSKILTKVSPPFYNDPTHNYRLTDDDVLKIRDLAAI